jgi:hypothetical protein
VIAYASRTGTRRNLAALRDAGWRILVSARGVLRNEGFRYALDNGAWTAFTQREPFDVGAFEKALDLMGAEADWVASPDIVGGGMRSLELSESWLPRLMDARLVLIPVQDGLTASDVRPLLGNRVGIFLGGSTEWKLATMREWGELAREVGCYYHVARVNTRRRIEMCSEAGATSFDGSSASRFAASLPRLERARCQPSLFGRAS